MMEYLAIAAAGLLGLGEPGELRELVPGVRVGAGIVEFAGAVCADASHAQTPVVYLELLVTGPDSREHEALVVTKVKASAIHAGLLAAGLEHGSPVREEGGRRIPASGDAVRVEVAVVGEEGPGPFVALSDWVVRIGHEDDAGPAQRLTDAAGWGLVFAGSLLTDGGYAADETGTIVGLTGFGTEIIGAAWGLSPWAAVDEPVWIVDAERVARFGTAVVVRISALDGPVGDAGEVEAPSVADDRDAAGSGSE